MKYSCIRYFSTTNGSGVRVSVYVSGCRIRCKGCFNYDAWDFDFGKEWNDEALERVLNGIDKEYCAGLTLLGGEPLDEKNLTCVNSIIDAFRNKFGKSKDIWIYTGYNLSDLTEEQMNVVKKCDVVVDGPFVMELASVKLKFKGSSNQTIWKNVDGEFNAVG